MTPRTLTIEDLCQFTGTETWYRHALNRALTYTEGVKYVADRGGAYWLIDEIALANRYESKVKGEEFQVWKLLLTPEDPRHRAILQCEDGNDNVVYTKTIEFTDFPLPKIELWCTDNVILLPSEY